MLIVIAIKILPIPMLMQFLRMQWRPTAKAECYQCQSRINWFPFKFQIHLFEKQCLIFCMS
jgi:hypothetical protein